MKLLEKYFMVKLDNYQNEGFNQRTMQVLVELEIYDCIDRDHLKQFDEDQKELMINKNKFNQEKALKLLLDMLKARGECPKCHGFITSRFEEIKKRNIKERVRKIVAKQNEKVTEVYKNNAARMNATMTPEKRAEAQKKRIATMAKKKAEKEKINKLNKNINLL